MNTSIAARHPPFMLMVGFLILIAVGTVVFSLPGFTHTPLTFLRAAFMATSAVTVTGLSVIDPADFTTAGYLMLICMVEAGGLGFITFAALAMMALHRRLSIDNQILAKETLGVTKLVDINTIVRFILLFALSIQLVGWILLFILWLPEKGPADAAFRALFYTVMAFNNAGFALSAESVMPYSTHASILLLLSALIIIGGLGIFVVMDILSTRRYSALKANTRLILITTAIINVVFFIAFFLIERNNPNTLGAFSNTLDKLTNAWFLAITPRTAGFNNIPIQEVRDASTILMLFLMFIGGGAYSTAGGLKIGTVLVLLLTTRAFFYQQESVTAFHRSVPNILVKRAIAILIVMLNLVFLSVFILMLAEPQHNFSDVFFEVISALSTVGLSRGITNSLTPLGEAVLMFMMFIGRVGPLTVGYLIALPKSTRVNYPPMQIDVG